MVILTKTFSGVILKILYMVSKELFKGGFL